MAPMGSTSKTPLKMPRKRMTTSLSIWVVRPLASGRLLPIVNMRPVTYSMHEKTLPNAASFAFATFSSRPSGTGYSSCCSSTPQSAEMQTTIKTSEPMIRTLCVIVVKSTARVALHLPSFATRRILKARKRRSTRKAGKLLDSAALSYSSNHQGKIVIRSRRLPHIKNQVRNRCRGVQSAASGALASLFSGTTASRRRSSSKSSCLLKRLAVISDMYSNVTKTMHTASSLGHDQTPPMETMPIRTAVTIKLTVE
mmetsp:Transcript_11752/g.31258  ORF Transcript_11752/g.31258 Transcript_11752/m.31258 type:complete len:254 (-) Transcript_11752:9-770(-)